MNHAKKLLAASGAVLLIGGAACSEPSGSDQDDPTMPAATGGVTEGADDSTDSSANEDASGDATGEQTDTGADESSGDSGWEPDDPASECPVAELVPPHVYVRRVKTLLTGLAPTEQELSSVVADPTALRDLVAQWVQTEAFLEKLRDYLAVTLQQAPGTRLHYFTQLGNPMDAGDFVPPPELYANLDEAFVRTALAIVDEDQPFSEIASTQTWMLTTAAMSYLLAAEQRDWGPITYYSDPLNVDGVTFNASTPLEVQIEHQVFFHANPGGNGCTEPEENPEVDLLFSKAMGQDSGDCETHIEGLFNAGDFEDWRPVSITTLGANEALMKFYDAPSIRDSSQLALRSAKAGFFSAPAFLAGWRTNEDNSFRVTTNQSLIVGLGLAFEDSDITMPLGDEGLAADHAAPGTECYGCHKNLDPMRNFFANVYYAETYAVRDPDQRLDTTPSFSFQGHSSPGTDLADFGAIIADHPAFSRGWAQKLCYLANAQPCDEDDPEFGRVVRAFEDDDLNFRTLVTELFSSPLVTGASCPEETALRVVPGSVSRREHLCTALEQRLDVDACNLSSTIRELAAGLPTDSWSRGGNQPNQPAQSSLFYAATLDSLCDAIGLAYVDAPDSLLQSDNMSASVQVLVETVMGLPPSDPRSQAASDALTEHIEAAEEVSGSAKRQLASAFTVACTSPFVASTGF